MMNFLPLAEVNPTCVALILSWVWHFKKSIEDLRKDIVLFTTGFYEVRIYQLLPLKNGNNDHIILREVLPTETQKRKNINFKTYRSY